jgi:hypothetical protein
LVLQSVQKNVVLNDEVTVHRCHIMQLTEKYKNCEVFFFGRKH